jgi:hypothetical protein
VQIRSQLTAAGLDVATTADLKQLVSGLKLAMEADAAKRGREEKVDKSGSMALGFLDSLLSILSMVYKMTEQGDGPSNASDFRLVVDTWQERPAQRRRCCTHTQAHIPGAMGDVGGFTGALLSVQAQVLP